jgi:hypothetical protein
MKTQIIQLETYDDVISVRDKMGWSQAARILLVWPANETILARRLDLALLQRYSQAMGTQLALVSTDPDVRYYARQLRIPVFKTLRKAQSSSWHVRGRKLRRVQRQNPSPDPVELRQQLRPAAVPWYAGPFARRGYYAFTFMILVASLGVLGPSAQISLAPEKRMQEANITVTASPGLASPNLSGGLPLLFQVAVVEGRASVPATGSVLVPEKAAAGSVKLTNLTNRRIAVPAGTIVSSSNSTGTGAVRFVSSREVWVPAGAGRSITVPVRALQPGKLGNLPAKSLNTIEGTLGLSLAVENTSPTSGGTSLEAASPAPVDYEALYEQLRETLLSAALDETLAGLPPGSLVIAPTMKLLEVLEQTYDPAQPLAGQPGLPEEELSLTLRLEFQVQAVSGHDLKAVAEGVLNAGLPPGFVPLFDTLTVHHTTLPDSQDGETFTWRIKVARSTSALILEDQVARSLRGLSPQQANQLLADSLQLASPPLIQVEPPWWPRLPLWENRLHVQANGL